MDENDVDKMLNSIKITDCFSTFGTDMPNVASAVRSFAKAIVLLKEKQLLREGTATDEMTDALKTLIDHLIYSYGEDFRIELIGH